MANHSYLKKLAKPITPEEMETELHRINDYVFDGAFAIKRWPDAQGELAAWTLMFNQREGLGCQVWLNDGRNIEMPHSLAWGEVFHWVQDLIMITLRETYGGDIYDDATGDEKFWVGESPEIIDTHKKYWMRGHSPLLFFDHELEERWLELIEDGPRDLVDLALLGSETEMERIKRRRDDLHAQFEEIHGRRPDTRTMHDRELLDELRNQAFRGRR